MNKGYVIMAQNTHTTDYMSCAKVLRDSILNVMPSANVTIIGVNELPHGDLAPESDWKLINDWQVYEASPYEYTIKLEADMYIPRSIDHWWDILKTRDLNICTTIRNFKNEISSETYYRQIFIKNKLPQTYNAITYFKKSDLACEFFTIVRDIFENWNSYRELLNYCPDDNATTDVVYAIAASLLGTEKCTLPTFTGMSMIHMKRAINKNISDYWPNEFLYEIRPDLLRINTYPQLYPFHYHIKDFSETIVKELCDV